MGLFEKYLSIWIGLSIFLGVVLGSLFPSLFHWISTLQVSNVNLIVACFIWVMIYPMMIQVDFDSIGEIKNKPRGLFLTLVVNWLIKPFTMLGISCLFFKVFFKHLVPATLANEYIAGMILLGVAPCTAMVFVWSQLTKGDANYTLVQVAINDLIMVIVFAPLSGFLLGISNVFVPWTTLFLSVGLYVLIPLLAGYFTRKSLNSPNNHSLNSLLGKLKPYSIFGLLATVVLLFGFQAKTLLLQPLNILLIAIPLLIQSYLIFALSYFWAWRWKLPHNIAAPASLIGTSNFFELAVAVAIGLFGLNSAAALATVVGVLVEVPVMLSLVNFANRTQSYFPKTEGVFNKSTDQNLENSK